MGGFTQALLEKMQEKQKSYQASFERQLKYYESVQSDPNATPEAKKAAIDGMQATQYALQHNKPKSMAQFYGTQLSELGSKLVKFGTGKGAKGKGKGGVEESQGQPQRPGFGQAPEQAPPQSAQAGHPAKGGGEEAPQTPQRPPRELPVKQGAVSKAFHGATRGLATVGGVGLKVAGGVLQGASRVANGPDSPAPPPMNPTAMQTYGPGEADAAKRSVTAKEIEENPSLSPEDKKAAQAKLYGVTEKPLMKAYKLPNGQIMWADANHPEQLPPGATAIAPGAAVKPKGLKFDKDTDEVVNQDTLERYSRGADDLPAEVAQMFKGNLSIEARKNQDAMRVAYARGEAMAGSRVIQVIDPSNPEEVTFMAARDAVKQGAHSPAGIAFQVDKSITKAFTSGKPAENINYFNTAIDHLKVLKEAAAALNNNDYPAFNRLANQWATATGNPAPTNLDAVRNAVAGEISKTFKGTGATNEEVDLINTTIHNAQSPDQITGAADTYIRLMDGKVKALKNQFEKGKQGKPNFPGGDRVQPSGKVVSLKAAMALPQNKGKSEAEVRKDIESHGHKVVD